MLLLLLLLLLLPLLYYYYYYYYYYYHYYDTTSDHYHRGVKHLNLLPLPSNALFPPTPSPSDALAEPVCGHYPRRSLYGLS